MNDSYVYLKLAVSTKLTANSSSNVSCFSSGGVLIQNRTLKRMPQNRLSNFEVNVISSGFSIKALKTTKYFAVRSL